MAKVVNLRRARKRRARDEAREKGDENAARHGEPVELRRAREAELERLNRVGEGHRRERDDDD